jgi:hypothetical protein
VPGVSHDSIEPPRRVKADWAKLGRKEEGGRKETTGRPAIQAELERELKALMEKLGISGLQIIWSPDDSCKLSGEVKGKVIQIYEPSLEKARETLMHEVLDYLVSQPIEPFKSVTNKLIELINEEVYKRKERVVEALIELFDEREIGEGNRARN